MRKILPFIVLFFLVAGTWLIASASDTPDIQKEVEKKERVYPVAAGVWYPGDGPLPEKPMRYYRARCWPGCHSGASLGLYPESPLNDEPIFPTSTIDAHHAADKTDK
jgi:hypothetical protein